MSKQIEIVALLFITTHLFHSVKPYQYKKSAIRNQWKKPATFGVSVIKRPNLNNTKLYLVAPSNRVRICLFRGIVKRVEGLLYV